MVKITFTNVFEKWLLKLKDHRAKAIINQHLDRIAEGNLGNTRFVGEGIFEKKINYANGYRLYYFLKGDNWIILLCGGDKSSQQSDIKQAKKIKVYLSANKKG
jgi:putative addiction module killer protein